MVTCAAFLSSRAADCFCGRPHPTPPTTSDTSLARLAVQFQPLNPESLTRHIRCSTSLTALARVPSGSPEWLALTPPINSSRDRVAPDDSAGRAELPHPR